MMRHPLLAFVFVMVLAACGSDGDSPGPDNASNNGTSLQPVYPWWGE